MVIPNDPFDVYVADYLDKKLKGRLIKDATGSFTINISFVNGEATINAKKLTEKGITNQSVYNFNNETVQHILDNVQDALDKFVPDSVFTVGCCAIYNPPDRTSYQIWLPSNLLSPSDFNFNAPNYSDDEDNSFEYITTMPTRKDAIKFAKILSNNNEDFKYETEENN